MNATCLCNRLRCLAKDYDEGQAQSLILALNCHLRDLRALLIQSKSLSRKVQYRITPTDHRTAKVLTVESVNLSNLDQVCERFKEDADSFWISSDDAVHTELRRRLACVVIFLRSKLDVKVWVPPQIVSIFQGQQNYAEFRHSGRKYIKIAQILGGLGSLLWLPLEIPPSTYERYLNIDDDQVFSHLKSLGPPAGRYTVYTGLAQRLIISQLGETSPSCSYHNLLIEYPDVIPASEYLLLVLHALGGCDIPDILLKNVRLSQRRWNADGEMSSISAAQFGLPVELVHLISDEMAFVRTMASPYITKDALSDGTMAWSLCPEVGSFFSRSLRPQTVEELGATALKVICFACPPCYEGNTTWSAPQKKAIWPLLERATMTNKVQAPLRSHVLETFLYFCERDSVAVRRMAVDRATTFLRKSMPYYLHASVALFRSILDRLDGELARSNAQICDFLGQGPKPLTRRDHALQRRLHISQVENKIKSYDNDVPSFIYMWEAAQPLSSLDIEITSRLQGVAARFFQSVGDFVAARASLEQFLSLYTTNSIRVNTRRLIVGRLADIYCEMQEYPRSSRSSSQSSTASMSVIVFAALFDGYY